MSDQNASIFWAPSIQDRFLRADGGGLSAANPIGGVVNCQYWGEKDQNDCPIVGPNEKFYWLDIPGGTINVPYVAVRSKLFPNCYISLDGSGVTEQNPEGAEARLHYLEKGQATVQATPNVIFVYKQQQQGDKRRFSLESLAYPGVCLAINGTDITRSSDGGGGKVYASWGVNEYTILRGLAAY